MKLVLNPKKYSSRQKDELRK